MKNINEEKTDHKKKRTLAIRVWVNDVEKELIETNSAMVGIKSTSAYLRTLGLGYEPPSKLDNHSVIDLAKVNADQGRLGGLLKMLLTNEERYDPKTHTKVNKTIGEIEQIQRKLLKIVESL